MAINNKKQILKDYNLTKGKIRARLNEFRGLNEKKQFNEFLFCLLTPQSNAKKCWEAVEELSKLDKFESKKVNAILKTRTRFHNNKTHYVLEAKDNFNKIKPSLINSNSTDIIEIRNFIAENVKGYGLKEASHFLRNIGLSNNKIAILDRHILRNLREMKVIENENIKGKSDYLDKERRFIDFSKEINIPIDELDLLFWSAENGDIFK